MTIIVVKSSNTRIEKTQSGSEIKKQQAAIDQGGDYPLPFWLVVNDPYPPGRYVIAPQSYKVNQYQSLELDRYNLHLEPVKA